jgi:hypothetical protein
VRELVFIARGLLQVRKEGIWETDSIGGSKGKKSVTGVEKKKTALTSGTTVSATRSEERKALCALARTGLLARAGLGPRGEAGERHTRAGASGPRGRIGLPGRKLGREVKLFFFFLFKYFKAFSIDFDSYFEFESNHSNQKFKCNSMSAQTCF